MKTTNKEEIEELLNLLKGKTKEEGTKICHDKKFICRISREDSALYMLTMDLRFDRITLEIDNGIITKSKIG